MAEEGGFRKEAGAGEILWDGPYAACGYAYGVVTGWRGGSTRSSIETSTQADSLSLHSSHLLPLLRHSNRGVLEQREGTATRDGRSSRETKEEFAAQDVREVLSVCAVTSSRLAQDSQELQQIVLWRLLSDHFAGFEAQERGRCCCRFSSAAIHVAGPPESLSISNGTLKPTSEQPTLPAGACSRPNSHLDAALPPSRAPLPHPQIGRAHV